MVPPAKAPRSVVVKASRETIALALAACAATFALAYAVHPRTGVDPVTRPSSTRESSITVASVREPPAREWTGHLAEVAPLAAAVPTEPMTSASLVVSPSQLPPVTSPARPAGKRPCEGASCAARTNAAPPPPVPTPPARPSAGGPGPATTQAEPRERGWPANINPFNHLPDTATLKQPFTYVGDKVAGWFR